MAVSIDPLGQLNRNFTASSSGMRAAQVMPVLNSTLSWLSIQIPWFFSLVPLSRSAVHSRVTGARSTLISREERRCHEHERDREQAGGSGSLRVGIRVGGIERQQPKDYHQRLATPDGPGSATR